MNIGDYFLRVVDALYETRLIAWDGCHKIYLALDEYEEEWFKENYEINFTGTPDEMYTKILEWWEDSCQLRFINSVRHTEPNPNDGYASLIPQFAEDEEEDNWDWAFEDEEEDLDTELEDSLDYHEFSQSQTTIDT